MSSPVSSFRKASIRRVRHSKDMSVEAYRSHRLTGSQLRRVLGIGSRDELDAFLHKRGVWLDYSLEDFRREGEITAPLLLRREDESEQGRRAGGRFA